MLVPIRRNLLRWGTPDPEGNWMMYGHLLIEGEKTIIVDPPMVPHLISSISRLGDLEAVILTTAAHIRGSKYICSVTGATLYIPNQVKSADVDPDFVIEVKNIQGFVKYRENTIFGLKPIRMFVKGDRKGDVPWVDEYALLTDHNELIVGDIAIGTPEGTLKLAPEWFPSINALKPQESVHLEFKRIVRKIGAKTLLASHGADLYGNLQEELKRV